MASFTGDVLYLMTVIMFLAYFWYATSHTLSHATPPHHTTQTDAPDAEVPEIEENHIEPSQIDGNHIEAPQIETPKTEERVAQLLETAMKPIVEWHEKQKQVEEKRLKALEADQHAIKVRQTLFEKVTEARLARAEASSRAADKNMLAKVMADAEGLQATVRHEKEQRMMAQRQADAAVAEMTCLRAELESVRTKESSQAAGKDVLAKIMADAEALRAAVEHERQGRIMAEKNGDAATADMAWVKSELERVRTKADNESQLRLAMDRKAEATAVELERVRAELEEKRQRQEAQPFIEAFKMSVAIDQLADLLGAVHLGDDDDDKDDDDKDDDDKGLVIHIETEPILSSGGDEESPQQEPLATLGGEPKDVVMAFEGEINLAQEHKASVTHVETEPVPSSGGDETSPEQEPLATFSGEPEDAEMVSEGEEVNLAQEPPAPLAETEDAVMASEVEEVQLAPEPPATLGEAEDAEMVSEDEELKLAHEPQANLGETKDVVMASEGEEVQLAPVPSAALVQHEDAVKVSQGEEVSLAQEPPATLGEAENDEVSEGDSEELDKELKKYFPEEDAAESAAPEPIAMAAPDTEIEPGRSDSKADAGKTTQSDKVEAAAPEPISTAAPDTEIEPGQSDSKTDAGRTTQSDKGEATAPEPVDATPIQPHVTPQYIFGSRPPKKPKGKLHQIGQQKFEEIKRKEAEEIEKKAATGVKPGPSVAKAEAGKTIRCDKGAQATALEPDKMPIQPCVPPQYIFGSRPPKKPKGKLHRIGQQRFEEIKRKEAEEMERKAAEAARRTHYSSEYLSKLRYHMLSINVLAKLMGSAFEGEDWVEGLRDDDESLGDFAFSELTLASAESGPPYTKEMLFGMMLAFFVGYFWLRVNDDFHLENEDKGGYLCDYETQLREYIDSHPPDSLPVSDETIKSDANAPTTSTAGGLASTRNNLLPESTSSARFTTTSGPNSTPVSGTVYVGAHPGQEARILWIQYGKSPALIPTVYTLWQNPDIVPLLHTPDFVAEQKLRQGADLMIPGLVKARGSKWDSRATKGSVVAVAGMTRDTVPLWVGTCEIDISQFGDDFRSQKGIAVNGLHWEGDEIWNWATVSGAGGKAAPASLDGWIGLGNGVDHALEHLTLSDADEDGGEDGGAALQGHAGAGGGGESQPKVEEDNHIPTTDEVDKAFHQAFLYSIHKAKQSNKGPNYGFDFPIQPSFLIANMVQPNLYHQSQHYNIKKTSWKNAKKYIKHLDKSGLVKSKDRNGGETVILGIDFEDQQITSFVPYRLPSTKTSDAKPPAAGSSTDSPSTNDPSKGQKLNIKTVYRAASKLVPDLLSSKTDFYTAQQISSAVKSYIDERPELGGQSSSSIKLDAFIANNILGSNAAHEQEDSRVIAAGRINRGALQKRILDDNRLCQPYFVIERSSTQEASEQKPKPGLPPHVHIVIEKRTGTKVVTRLSNLEPFFINPNLLAPELQKKCAGSCSVAQAQGGKTGLLEITIQGDQSKVLTSDVLPKRGVDVKWIDVVDKTKPKKK
ncbi:hypothetical protein N0V82_004938 [Gnomoniopsis sp. IMI 355080]|nr:hypothetical protein N0V82_004938 [Gnomoniopsis sp. IMI 355080]